MSNQIVPKFGTEISDAINNDYLLIILITSHTSTPKNPSLNLPYGLGKSTLLLWLAYGFNDQDWDKVFRVTAYNPVNYLRMLIPNAKAETRKRSVQWDDVQLTAPAEKSVPRAVVSLASYITCTRPECALHLWSAPNINSISAPLRRLVTHELIVYKRGFFEVQKVTYKKNIYDPRQDQCRITYIEQGTFPALPDEIQIRYNEWRAAEKKKLFGRMERNIEAMVRLDEEGTGSVDIAGHVVKLGSGYGIRIPMSEGEKLYGKQATVKVLT
jgi:hypothetical protein